MLFQLVAVPSWVGASWWFAIPHEIQAKVWPTEDFELVTSHVETTVPEDDLFAGITAKEHP